MLLDGKVAIITGAAGDIGSATATKFVEEGALVLGADVRAEPGLAVEALLLRSPLRFGYSTVDVADEAQVRGLIREAVGRFGRLDIMVNNAAILRVGTAIEMDGAEFARVMDVNVAGTFYGCKYALQQFEEQSDGGVIVNIGSISALVGLPAQAAYCASKGAILQLSRQIAVDYSSRGIRCNVVGPGSVEGSLLDSYLADLPDPEAAVQNIVDAHPIGRLGKPREVAEAIVFLASERASFITGANLQVDGGYSAR